ncbi:hypothetical protein BDV35DRAFT_350418 [Aspergillus flavus]|uniref:Uncharacterized protein n=1 Tax=Aspergillus flavus TaxID=5059 RepID=A0A5N6GZH1_ASPFL|nr:hypothetical protein BDV35DRAFT_350418 [Aspergillus flavus]
MHYAVRNKDKKLPKTKELHQQTLDLWFDFTADPENGFQHYKTVPGCLPPSHDMVKAFIRWRVRRDSSVVLEKLPKLKSPKQTEKRYTVSVLVYLSSKANTDSTWMRYSE